MPGAAVKSARVPKTPHSSRLSPYRKANNPLGFALLTGAYFVLQVYSIDNIEIEIEIEIEVYRTANNPLGFALLTGAYFVLQVQGGRESRRI
jgi:hypothetical protein